MDEAQDIFVPRTGERLACRRADHAQGGLGCGASKRANAPASKSMSRRTRCVTASRRTCWKRAPICAPSRYCWVTRKLEHTAVYLHLSRRHLQAVANPLEAIDVSSPTGKAFAKAMKR